MKERIAGKSHALLAKWEEKSREFVTNFVELFGRDGRINNWLREGRAKVARAISPPPDYGLLPIFEGDESSPDSSPTSSPPVKRGRFVSHEESDSSSDDDDDDGEYY